MNEAFITGSRAYGTVREDSDIDLAVVVTPEEAQLLKNLSEQCPKTVFGRLNLVIFVNTKDDLERYKAWKKVNEELKRRRPVTRQFAIDALELAGAHDDLSQYE